MSYDEIQHPLEKIWIKYYLNMMESKKLVKRFVDGGALARGNRKMSSLLVLATDSLISG